MSKNNNAGGMKLVCVKCGQVWSIHPHQPEISNNFRSSTATIPHESIIRCPSMKCQQPYMLMIQSVSFTLSAQAIDDAMAEQIEGSSVIKPNISLIN